MFRIILALRQLALIFSLSATTIVQADSPLHIAYAEYKPYSFDLYGKASGIEVDVLNEALNNRLGIPLQHSIFPWKRVQQYVKSGEVDAYVAVATPERLDYAHASQQAVAYGSVSAFSHRSKPPAAAGTPLTLQQLQPYSIGVVAGSGWAQRNLNEHKTEAVYSTESLVDMLTQGRIDMIVENPYILHFHLRSNPNKDLVIQENPISGQDIELVLLISKQSAYADMLPRIDNTLKAMQADGSLQKIFDSYR